VERRAILQALQTAAGDRIRAAKLLGISKTTIYRKLREYGLEDADRTSST
jgi:two-component system response regulator HydG